ncbi:MAG TPA: POTRA domain-containing protein [Candidatus Methylomirabilis sp.]|nr:POTRA domain-containing protein [Candidatus Methylomirabilis sp.]
MKLRWGTRLWIVALLMLPAAAARSFAQTAALPASPDTVARAPIVAVRIVSEDGRVLAESPSGISVEIGKPLDRDQVASSIRALYSTGDYADLRAVVTPEGAGERLDFIVQENLFYNQVNIEGLTPPPTDASAAAAMQLSLGKPFRQEDVDEGLDRLREVLKDEGLYKAGVSAESVPNTTKHTMDVVVRIKPGPRARVASVQLKNATEFRDSELLSRFKMKAGQPLTAAQIQRGTERIRKFLVKKGRLSTRATVHRGEYNAAKNSVPLELEVTAGPRVDIAATGAKLSKGELKRLVPIFQEGAVDTDLLEEGKRNIRERLERDGFFDAQVSYTTETREVQGKEQKTKGTEELITYHIERGARHRLVGIEITGNHYFSTELLRGRLQVYGAAFGSRGRFSRRLIDSDAESMRALYDANGFLDAKVEDNTQDNYKGKEGDIFVKFDVTEGPQTKVTSLSFEGIHAFKEEELLSVVGSTPGQPYSDLNVSTDRDNILAMYFNEGFPEASFSATANRVTPEMENGGNEKTNAGSARNGGSVKEEEESENGRSAIQQAPPVQLVYHITEGPQTRVKGVLLNGYRKTRPYVLRREIRVTAGEPLREGDVVESQRRLYNLGIFNRVTIEPQNPGGSDPDKNIVVLVEEAKRYTMAYGGGFEVQRLASTTSPTGGQIQAAPRGIFEITKANLTGRADSLSLKLRGSTIEDRALLGYSIPNAFGNSHYSEQATAYTEKTQDINTFTEMRYEGSLQLTDQMTPRTTLLYRYAFRKVLVSNLNSHIAAEEIPLFEQPTLVSEFGATWLRDARDNPADASKGTFNSVDFSLASTGIGSSSSFMRVFFQNSTYYPIKRRFSFARSFRIGILEPFANTESLTFPPPTATQCTSSAPTGPTPEIIPLPERFFAGGGTSLRGFALNQAGPRDPCTGFPVGGQAMLVFNQEFRFPMRLPYFGTQLGGAFFYDGGNVYSRLDHVTLRTYPPMPVFVLQNPSQPPGPTNPTLCLYNCTNELNYFAHTVGFGIRYGTPVGPIRIDLGYQINRPFFVIPCVSSTSSTTPPGPPCFKGAQLPRLQIFFNLGSTF